MNKYKMNMPYIKSIAKIAFMLSLLNKEKLQQWGSFMVMKGNTDDLYLELATCKDDRNVLNILGEIQSDKEATFLFISFFGGFFRESWENEIWQKIEEKVVTFNRIVDMSEVDDSIKIFLNQLKDDYDLRNEGFGGSMDMPIDLINFLSQFSDFFTIKAELEKVCFPTLTLN